KSCAPWGLAAAERIVLEVVGVLQMIHSGQENAEGLSIPRDAAHRHAAEAYAVVGALPANEPQPMSLAARTVIREGYFERGIDRFGTGVGEEHIIQIGGRQRGESRGCFERSWMTHLERGSEVHGRNLSLHCLDYLRPAMPGVDAPQPCSPIEHRPAVV